MFHSTDMGEQLEEVVETEDCKVLRMKDTGDGRMTIYRVFDGVYLMYNDFHMSHCYSRFHGTSRIFCIDHCREGRIEHRTDRDMRCYMESGDLRLDRRAHHSGDMYFPVSHYHGLTEGFFLDCAETAEHIFSELYTVPAKIRMDYFKIKVMELLLFPGALELGDYRDERPYFYSGQIEKLKAVHKLLTEHPAENYTTDALTKQFALSPAALKSGFKGVYGSPIYTYIHTHRMNAAARTKS